MSEMTLLVINVNYKATVGHLLPVFRPHGAIDVILPLDAPGTAIVTFSTSAQARWAIPFTDNLRHMGRALRVMCNVNETQTVLSSDDQVLISPPICYSPSISCSLLRASTSDFTSTEAIMLPVLPQDVHVPVSALEYQSDSDDEGHQSSNEAHDTGSDRILLTDSSRPTTPMSSASKTKTTFLIEPVDVSSTAVGSFAIPESLQYLDQFCELPLEEALTEVSWEYLHQNATNTSRRRHSVAHTTILNMMTQDMYRTAKGTKRARSSSLGLWSRSRVPEMEPETHVLYTSPALLTSSFMEVGIPIEKSSIAEDSPLLDAIPKPSQSSSIIAVKVTSEMEAVSGQTNFKPLDPITDSHEVVMQKEQPVKEVIQYSKCGTMSRTIRVKLPKASSAVSDISPDSAAKIDAYSPDSITRDSPHSLFEADKAIVRLLKVTLPPSPPVKTGFEKTLHMKTTHKGVAGSMRVRIKLPLPSTKVSDISMVNPTEMSAIRLLSTRETEISLFEHGEVAVRLPPRAISHTDVCVGIAASTNHTTKTIESSDILFEQERISDDRITLVRLPDTALYTALPTRQMGSGQMLSTPIPPIAPSRVVLSDQFFEDRATLPIVQLPQTAPQQEVQTCGLFDNFDKTTRPVVSMECKRSAASKIPVLATIKKTKLSKDGGFVLPASCGNTLDDDLTTPHNGEDLAQDVHSKSLEADAYPNGEDCHFDSVIEQVKFDSKEESHHSGSTAYSVSSTHSDPETVQSAPSTSESSDLKTSVEKALETSSDSITVSMAVTPETADAERAILSTDTLGTEKISSQSHRVEQTPEIDVSVPTDNTAVGSEAQQFEGAVDGPEVSDNNMSNASELMEPHISQDRPVESKNVSEEEAEKEIMSAQCEPEASLHKLFISFLVCLIAYITGAPWSVLAGMIILGWVVTMNTRDDM